MGEAAYGKTRSGPWEPLQVRAKRGQQWPPRQVVTRRRQPPSEWTRVPVPAVISRELFETVQEQLGENQRRERTKARGAKYLLQGLICCARCGYVWHGITSSVKSTAGDHYEYYRCAGNDRYRFGGERLCHTRAVRLGSLDAAVWEQVCGLLENPERLAQEYGRRLKEPPNGAGQAQREQAEKQLGKVRQAIARLIDGYAAGYLEKDEFEPRMTGMRQRVAVHRVSLPSLFRPHAAIWAKVGYGFTPRQDYNLGIRTRGLDRGRQPKPPIERLRPTLNIALLAERRNATSG